MTIIHGKKTDISVVKAFAESKGGKLLSESYQNMNASLTWQCACGHVFVTSFNKVYYRKQWCPVCGKKKGDESHRLRMKIDPTVAIKISASKQGLTLDTWDGFVADANAKQVKLRRLNHRYKNDILFKLKLNCRSHISRFLKQGYIRDKKTMDYIGCSHEALKNHIESLFYDREDGTKMTWDNWSIDGWHIDHIIPLCSAQNKQDFEKLLHYTNIRPLWSEDNLSKIKDDKMHMEHLNGKE